MTALLLAVDVGSTAAQAGLFDPAGRLLATASVEFPLLRPQGDHAVQRMDAIWNAVGGAIRGCLAPMPEVAGRVAGIGFSAVASLVLDHEGAAPLEGGADVINAMDQRAGTEAQEIAATGDAWLTRMGGSLPAETHLARLLWMQRQTPESWARVTGVHDLCDALVRRATGVDAHALGALATQWPYLPEDIDQGGWRQDLLARIGLDDLWTLGALPDPPIPAGQRHGRLAEATAAAFGLTDGIPVAAGLIHAHAGMLGVLGRGLRSRPQATLALVGGDSSSFMAVAPAAREIPAVSGPFADAVFPGLWLHAGVQAWTGAALDAILEHHPGGPRIASPDIQDSVAAEILALMDSEGPAFAAQRHVVPDWLGNRSPSGDARLRALLTGVGEETSYRAFLENYFATARGVALQARQIIAHMNRHGAAISRVALSGTHVRNRLLVRLYRDALGCDIMLTGDAEPVLRGAAMAAAVAARLHPDLFVAMDLMTPPQIAHRPDPGWARAHAAAYRIYLKLYEVRNVVAHEARALERLPAADWNLTDRWVATSPA